VSTYHPSFRPTVRLPLNMTPFVESFVSSVADTASKVARQSRSLPGARKLLKALANKKRVLVTTHMYPDPDAIASTTALTYLLRSKLPKDVTVVASLKGSNGGGLNAAFATLAEANFAEWDDAKLGEYDAIVMLDVQPGFSTSPLPPGVMPTAVIDHHRTRGRGLNIPFRDVRVDVGASSSIVFSYLRELSLEISPVLAATLLYGIETDLAGAAGHPGELDNVAMSNLTLIADTRRLYQMRYTELPADFYVNFSRGIQEATYAGPVLFTFLGTVDSPSMPAIVADFLLRFAGITWVLVTATHEGRLILSLRTNDPKISAGEMMRKLVNRIGEGGGHRTKAGGMVPLGNGTPTEVERCRKTLKRRLLKLVGLPQDTRFTRLVAPPTV
jgi:nanoRNase/pAp phosphatase (c-di-AMP/oligoRNAs hydrolase)